jgi:benzoate membrane transport protein
MALSSRELRRTLPALTASIPIAIVFFAVLGIILTAAGPKGLALSEERTSGWIAVVYGLPMLPTLVLSIRYRQPLVFTGNIFAIIFFVSLGDQIAFPDLAGASLVAGALVLVAAAFGLTGPLARWIPAPIVHGLIAGAVTPFVVDVFSSLSTSAGGVAIPPEIPLMVGAALATYLLSQRFLGSRIPAILPSFVAGLLVAFMTGQLGEIPSSLELPSLEVVRPGFSWTAIVTATPVLVALLTVQSNVPSVIYLRTQGFRAPERVANVVSGVGTVVGSLFGPIAVSLALPPLLLAAGPGAGERSIRYRSVYLPVATGLLIALFAGTAADLSVLVPPVLLLAMAGLALMPALVAALREITTGPLILGPLFAFVIALSEISLFGLGRFFWSLVLGTAVSLLMERDGWKRLGPEVADGAEGSGAPAEEAHSTVEP